jgi:rhamnulokinase
MAYLALDLGAGSGRAIVGNIANGKLELTEIHRFGNAPVKIGNTLYWDFPALFANIKEGIRLAVARGYSLRGIAVDTWGVDFGLIDRSGRLLSNPVCYRDNRTRGMADEAMKRVSRGEFYASTGIQQMEINSVFQLLGMTRSQDSTLTVADKLLFTPDLVNYFLTGAVCNEYTIASTSQLLDARSRGWDKSLFERLDLPHPLMSDIVQPCTLLGTLTDDIADETGAGRVAVFAVGSHDTASAIAAIPMEGNDCAFLSSGTWSLLGVTLDQPILTEAAMTGNFTNEGGVNGKILFMRNITGLWLLQRLMAEWEKSGERCDYDHLMAECEKASPGGAIVDPDDTAFNNPASMTAAIGEFCTRTGQQPPRTRGELVRCVLESLAAKYRDVMTDLQACTGRQIRKLCVVGGGSRNALLNQYIANSLGVEVVTGLVEATAIGNIAQQAIANGELTDLAHAHRLIGNSFDLKSYYPI